MSTKGPQKDQKGLQRGSERATKGPHKGLLKHTSKGSKMTTKGPESLKKKKPQKST